MFMFKLIILLVNVVEKNGKMWGKKKISTKLVL